MRVNTKSARHVPRTGPKETRPLTLEKLIADEFPLQPDLIYLNHAAVAPWPRRTAAAVQTFAEENMRAGAANYPAWLKVQQSLRTQCAAFINASSADDIAFLKNTSEALSVVAHGFPWAEGDNVVIGAEEFPSNRIVWESLKPRAVTVRFVELSRQSDPEQALLAAADGRTRLISVSSVQYASGLRLDLARFGELCRSRAIAFCVDAIQGLGVFAHDVDAMGIDFLMADAHKWLLGPEGVAVFYCHPNWRDRLTLHQFGWHMVNDAGNFDQQDWQIATSARRFECGSPNMLGIHALQASLSLLVQVGISEIEQRVLARAQQLFASINAQRDLELISSSAPGRYAGIVTFRHRHRKSDALHARLRELGVVCAARGGGIRFSPHFYTPLEQLDRALSFAMG
jgi:cysteine desulfurase/selenocysteine lyase